jgi:hypothetical protein
MSGRLLAAWLPLLLAGGCLDEHHTRVVSSGPMAPAPPASRTERYVSPAPATEATAQRVLAVGQKVVLANPQMGLRPIFLTVGSPQPEIFHRGGTLEGYQVVISEGLANRCVEDAHLAAVLCLELGKMVSEREALASPAMRQAEDRPPPPSEAIGRDSRGTFGPPDGTRLMELAKYESGRPRPGTPPFPPPPPDVLARKYLTQAGYDAAALADVAPLLRQAEDNFNVERQLGAAAGG